MCYANVSLITDYDVGVPGAPPVSHEEVVGVFGRNITKVRELLFGVIPALPTEREDEPEQLGERVREAAALIVGKDALEDFRLRVLPLAPPKQPRSV